MIQGFILVTGSALNIWYSLPSLRQPGSHGFYRFFAWESILGLFVLCIRTWFADPFAWFQLVSWCLLALSLLLLATGLQRLHSDGRSQGNIEATTRLVTRGIYHYIRHPLYASLLYLTWGLFFKSTGLLQGCLASIASTFLVATARADERECLAKFGQAYADYRKATKRFIPFIY